MQYVCSKHFSLVFVSCICIWNIRFPPSGAIPRYDADVARASGEVVDYWKGALSSVTMTSPEDLAFNVSVWMRDHVDTGDMLVVNIDMAVGGPLNEVALKYFAGALDCTRGVDPLVICWLPEVGKKGSHKQLRDDVQDVCDKIAGKAHASQLSFVRTRPDNRYVGRVVKSAIIVMPGHTDGPSTNLATPLSSAKKMKSAWTKCKMVPS